MNNLNYGIIGNCTTAALVSERGCIEWLCMPHFDSPSVFASLLDKQIGGQFSIEVSDNYKINQAYIAHTNMLTTRFKSDEGEFIICDFMPCYYYDGCNEVYRPSEIYRYIRYLSGSPRFYVNYQPMPDYARGDCRMNITDKHIESYSTSNSKDRQFLYSSLSLLDIRDKKCISLTKDEFFLLASNEKLCKVDLEREKYDYCKTLVYWLNWSGRTRKYKHYNEHIERSMLTLKLMSNYNGAILAAITTSLPECIGESRNWDYRFCWLRDASMTIETLVNLGHSRAAIRFIQFVRSTFVANHNGFQIMYGIRGEQNLHEEILEHLSGYEGSKSVRIGNAAYHQKQNDSYGYLMNLIYQYFTLIPCRQNDLENVWDMVKNIMSKVKKEWQKADKGIWEIRGAAHHFVSSKVMCWVALDRGSKIASLLKMKDYALEWRKEADKVRTDVFKKGWKENIQSFSQAYDNEHLDSSLLLMESYGFIDGQDERFKKTVKAVKKELFHNGLMYRYNTPDDFGVPKSAFALCTFWLVRALFVIGEKEESKKIYDEILGYANHLGLFGEDIDFKTKRLLGNFPQAYSHLAIINTALLFTEEDKESSIPNSECNNYKVYNTKMFNS
ncbi:MAG: glycoside hydrolase family 15 protein [Paludibacteraceae bacterium]|nr:glycoside hydrolase family 15 protein [Paludibacteraceae bacterium]